MKKRFAAALLLSACVLMAGPNAGRAQDDAQTLSVPSGLWLWSAEEAETSRTLALSLVDGSWFAEVDGSSVPVANDKGEISLSLPDGQAFRGKQADESSKIHGHWFQPPSPLDYQYVATPVILASGDDGIWQGDIQIQPRPFRVFLDIFKDEDQSIAAVIRNPSGNNTLGSTRFRVEADPAGGWSLVSGRGAREQRHRFFQQQPGELRLQYDRFEEPITLTKASESDRLAYVSRPGNEGEASYTLPPTLADGWRIATPEQAGLDRAVLDSLTQRIAGLNPRTEPHLIHSLLISRAGSLVYEEYFYGHNREKRHDVRSLGKVFGSVMIGALQGQGHAIAAEHRPVAKLLQGAGLPIDDDRKASITLGNLMTYTSGLDCDVNANESAGNEENMWTQDKEPNYWLYTAKLAMLHEPGKRYAYCSGSANLIGSSLVEFGKAPVHILFDELIAKPLSFGPYHWALAPNGEGYLGGGAYIRPRDILKVGAMYAAGGRWDERQIIDPDWVAESTKPRLEINPTTTGMTPEEFQNNYFGGSQAYIWTVNTINADERSYTAYQASGNGGQLLIVVPELDLAVGITGGNYRMGGIWGRWRDQIVGNYIIPAITNLPKAQQRPPTRSAKARSSALTVSFSREPIAQHGP